MSPIQLAPPFEGLTQESGDVDRSTYGPGSYSISANECSWNNWQISIDLNNAHDLAMTGWVTKKCLDYKCFSILFNAVFVTQDIDKNQIIGKYILPVVKQKSESFPNVMKALCLVILPENTRHSPDGTFADWIHSGPNRTIVSPGELFGVGHLSDNSAKKRSERLW